MKEAIGNLWTYPCDARAITTNGSLSRNGACIMGAGVAKQAKERFPYLPVELGRLIKEYGNRCFRIRLGVDYIILTFPTKHKWNQQASEQLIADSCLQAMQMATKFRWDTIALPRPGAGNGHLDWETQVKPVVSMLLDDRFHVISLKQ